MAGMNFDLPPKILAEIEGMAKDGADKERLLQLARKNFKKYLYDSEESVGVVAAQSLSEPATQMSLDGEEKIILKKDGITTVMGIGDFVDSLVNEFGYSERGWDVCDLGSYDIYVPSINDDEKIEWKRVLECSRHRSPKSLVRITLNSGRGITATDSHSFVVRRDNRIVPVSGKDLVPGERLPVVRHLQDNCTQHLMLKTVVDTAGVKKGMPERLRLDESLGWMFGAYLSEGNSTRHFVSLSNTDPEFLARIRDFADEYGFTYNEYDNDRGFALSHDIRINSTLLSRLLTNTCGTGSRNKRVPPFAYGATEGFVSGLLRGYFDGDGNVSVGRKMIRASSNSSELIDGIMLLLSRFGIFSTKQERKQFNLTIPYKYARAFASKIGLSVGHKRQRLDSLCGMDLEPSQDFTDMISGYGSLLLDTAKKVGFPTRYVNNFTKRGRIGRECLARYIKIFDRLAAERGVDIGKGISMMKRMVGSGVVWDEIACIERVEPSSDHVYDLTVEGTETFTTFEGVITHNTMRTYHFAGTAGIQVTLGLPRIIEIFDARKELKTPTMTIYLTPEHQSPDKAKKVAENIKQVKLRDLTLYDVIDLTNLEIICKLDTRMLKELELNPESIKKKIKLKKVKVDVKGDELRAASTNFDIKNLHKLKYRLLDSHLKGIRGVTQAIINKEGGEWVIHTLGSNLKKTLKIRGVNPERTTSNNIFEVMEVLGIEAARNAIINQANYTLDEQGLNVDIRYIMLLADLMTVTGHIKPIGRYGIAGAKLSVLARAAFEETKKHLISASIKNEHDDLSGIVENIMMNQVIPVGTGAFDLMGDIPRIAGEKKAAPAAKKRAPSKAKEKSKPKKKKK
ncbi:MAG: DNA-directed RNA polymerase subunit A'' [Candidatus Aenigmarchaeota archaeon]|nr:DNA-directed RNA polymerase subunit A'' [Candidatus Aenigmarchaeota archaeon]